MEQTGRRGTPEGRSRLFPPRRWAESWLTVLFLRDGTRGAGLAVVLFPLGFCTYWIPLGGRTVPPPPPPGQRLTCINTDSWIFILPYSLGDAARLVDLGSDRGSHGHRRDSEATLVSSRWALAFFFFFFFSTFLLSGTVRWAWCIPCGRGPSSGTGHF